MKEVCHRKGSTSRFALKKLAQKPIDVIATRYGKQHEKSAIASYVSYHRTRGVMINVQPCGLYVDPSLPWLAASPDGIVLDPTQCADKHKGCLEVKCPISCEKSLMLDVCKRMLCFALRRRTERCKCLVHTLIITKYRQRCVLPDYHGVTLSCGHS